MNSDSSVARYAWFVVAILFPVALLNYLDRQMLATMKASMVTDIPTIANKADWGIVLGSFKWVYALMSPIGGYIADRFSRKHVICVSLFTWSIATWVTGHVTSYHELLAARALMGVSEAFYIPTALALITDYHRGSTRSSAVGLHQAGIYAGLILGGFAGYVADSPDHGWRWAFSICGLLGVVYSIPLWFCLRNPPVSAEHSETMSLSVSVSVSRLVTNRNFLLLVAYFTLPAIAGWVVKDWMPDILREKFKLGQGHAGVTAVLWVQGASLIGGILGGLVADRWMRNTPRGRIYTSGIGMILFLPSLFGVGNAHSLSFAILGLIVFGIGWGFFDSNNMPILCQIVPGKLRATGYGLMNLVSISCGGFGDWGFGFLRDRHVPLNMIFGSFAGLALLSLFIVLAIKIPAIPQREV
ncbi:MAG: MFS transporter [Verrucomicrobiaceae bacterium]|nr:MAG: MFS transporter [Verrucomicrobiaceae bacterium]